MADVAASKVVVRSSRRRRRCCQCVTVWWCVLVIAWLFECVAGQNVHVSVQFNITEEQPIGFVVGQLPVRPGLRYRFSGDQPTQFRLDPDTGVITSRARVDREALPSRGGGAGTVDVIVQSVPAPPAQLFDVRINVLDINDNAPVFPRPTVHVTFVESDPPGTRVILETASDPDSGPNGTVSNYTIAAGDEHGRFRLSVASTGSAVARLLNLENIVELRRNEQSSYVLNISCQDGGSPPLYGFLLVNVDVTDINNNAPVFDDEAYHAVINETVAVGTTVLRVRATDADDGENAAVVYSIAAGDDRRQFAVDQTSGILTTARQPLICPAACSPPGNVPCRSKRCTLTIKATDSGRPFPLSAFAYVHVSLADVNDHAPVIWFRNQEPGRPLVVDESASEGDVVEAVSVTDADDGPNGQTTARLIGGNDEGAFAFIPSTIPELYFVLVAAASNRLQSGRRYNLTIEARDSGSPPRVTYASLIILVGQVDVSPPVFESPSYVASVSELAPVGSFVAALRATSSSASPVTYHISSASDENGNDDLSWFFVNSVTGLLTTNAQLDWRQRSSFNLTVKATAGMLSTLVSLYISVLPGYRTPPVFSRPEYRVVLSRANTTPGSLVTVVTASIEGMTGARYQLHDRVEEDYPDTFQISRTSGRIVTVRTLDAGMVYMLTVIAINTVDPVRLTSQVYATVNVTDPRNFPPVIYPVNYFVKVVGNQRIGSVITRIRSPNTSSFVIFSISNGAHSSKFDIDPSLGIISTTARLTPATVYRLVVVASDERSGLSSLHPALVRIYVMSSSSSLPPITFSQPLGYSFVVSEDDGRLSTAVVGRSVGRVVATANGRSELSFFLVDGDPDGVYSVSNSTGLITTARLVDRESKANYNLTVVAATDVDFATVYVSVVVSDVNDNAPRFRGGDVVEVDIHADSPVGLEVFAVRAADPDVGLGSTVRYRFVNSTDLLSVDPISGLLRLTASPTVDASFSVVVVAADSAVPSLSSTQTVRVNVGSVLDSNEPLFNTSTLWTAVSEATPINSRFFSVSSAAARPPTASSTVYYSVSRYHGIDDGRLRVFPDGWIYNARTLDREQTPEYVLTVAATEYGVLRNRSWLVEVVVVVLDDNDNSPAFDNATYSFSLVEGSQAADFAELIYATDADAGRNADLIYWIEGSTSGFMVDPLSGLLTTSRSFDREQLIADTGTDVVTLVVVAGDTGQVSRQSRVMVDITVSDINDNAPVFDDSVYSVMLPENSTVNSTVVVVAARDMDAGLNGTVFYSIRADVDQFAVEESTGRISLSKPVDVGRSLFYEFVVVASDRGTPTLTGTTTVRVTVVRTVPRPPKWTQLPPGSFQVGEDDAVGTFIGSVKAVNQNSVGCSRITYSTIPRADVPFVVEASTGRLFLDGALNYELRRQYDVTVVARDQSSLTTFTTLNVEVVPDMHGRSPRFVDAANFRYLVEADAPTGRTVFRATATGRDAGTSAHMRYSLSRQTPDGQLFNVDAASGTVTVAGALNARESATTYQLTLAVVDDALTASYRLTAQQTFTVDVVDGTPEFLSPSAVVLPSSARRGTLVTVVVAAAIGTHAVKYSVSDSSTGDAHMFRIDAATGRVYLRTSLTGRPVYSVVVVATDNQHPPRSSSLRMFVIIRSPSAFPDDDLVFSSSTYSGRVAENSPASSPVVTVAAASHAGQSSHVKYYITSITSPDSHDDRLQLPLDFEVSSTSGVIRTTRVLDRELGLGTFVLEVYAVDTSPDLVTPRTRNVTVSIRISYLKSASIKLLSIYRGVTSIYFILLVAVRVTSSSLSVFINVTAFRKFSMI